MFLSDTLKLAEYFYFALFALIVWSASSNAAHMSNESWLAATLLSQSLATPPYAPARLENFTFHISYVQNKLWYWRAFLITSTPRNFAIENEIPLFENLLDTNQVPLRSNRFTKTNFAIKFFFRLPTPHTIRGIAVVTRCFTFYSIIYRRLMLFHASERRVLNLFPF